MKRGPKPRLITKEFLEKVEHLAARGLSHNSSKFVMLLDSVRLGGMTLNRKIRIFRRVSKEVKPKALPRSQTQSTNKL